MADFVNEATQNLATDNLPVFYKYRYTFPDDFDARDKKNRFTNMFNFIKHHYALGNMVGGMEEYTKGMVATKPHIHIHFVSKHKADTIRKGIMREFELIGRCQSCKAEVLVDEPKFWRYALKQQMNETKRHILYFGFDKEWIDIQTEIAYACWKQSAEINVQKIEKKLERTSKERLFSYFDTLPFEYKSIKQSCILAYEYYANHEENVCVKTIDGYVNLYLLKNKYLSYDEFYEKTH